VAGHVSLLRLGHGRLRVKVLALTGAILGLGFGVLVALNIRHETAALIASHRDAARLLAGSIHSSIESGMLEGRPDIIRRLVQDLRTELREVRRLDVYRANGVEAFTDLETVTRVARLRGLDPTVIARISERRRVPGVPVRDLLFARTVETAAPHETYETLGHQRVLTLFRPLRNLEPCQACHGGDHAVRGVVRVSIGLDRLEAELRAARTRQVAVALLTILGVTGTLAVFLGRVVVQPIAHMASVARRIGGGDLDARVAVRGQDEISELGRTLNDMAAHLRTARATLEARNAELTAALERLRESTLRVQLLERVKGELAKFVPEAAARLLERNPDARELEKRERDVSVLFLDVAGYARLTEELPSIQLNQMIEAYFSSFLEIIRAHRGEVTETAGDGLMVIFQGGEGDQHALDAAGAAVDLVVRVRRLNDAWAGTYPPVSLHVGINSGPALVGATKLDAPGGARWTFTASGATSNVAARIAGLSRPDEILVGPETAGRVKGHYVLDDAGEHRLKNVSQPVRVFRLGAARA
jgi:class 3 adenylate cyclase